MNRIWIGHDKPRPEPKQYICPECKEPVQEVPPTTWCGAWGQAPDFSHLDGEPLCPVITADGYRPALPEVK